MQTVVEELTGVELRKHRRYEVSLPVKVRAKKGDDAALTTTTSRDISARGIYFSVPPDFDAGTDLEFELSLPPSLARGKNVRIRARARIIRLDRNDADEIIGVAAQIGNYKFVRG